MSQPYDKDIAAIRDAITSLQYEYDARVLLPCLLVAAEKIGAVLISADYMKPEQVAHLFEDARTTALKGHKGGPVQIVTEAMRGAAKN